MTEALRGRIIAFRADRLGARLVSLMNAMRIAEVIGADFRCAWTETTGVGDVFNDPTELFETAFVEEHFLTPEEWRVARPLSHSLRPGAAGSAAENAGILDRGQDIVVGNAFGVITLSGEGLEAITPEYRSQLSRIPFSAPVLRAMRSADDALQGHTAYHIRRGDLTDDLKAMNKPWPHKMVPNEFYEIHMRERLGESGGVVLFSDDADTVSHYRSAFPSLKTVDDIIDSDGLSEAQRDLVELYAMARCETIIAPERSAFSSTAADLFGSTKLAIAEALGETLTDRAHQVLMERLETRPESFSGDGDIGQSLVHVGNWLERQDRWADAARVFSGQVQRGLNISFVYPRTMTCQHRIADVDGVLATAETMRQRHVMHTKDLVNATILEGHAHLRKGDLQTGMKYIANAYWHDPSSGLARNVVPVMVELGILNHTNFLPITTLQRTIGHRRGPVKSLKTDLPGIELVAGDALPARVSRLETVSWDWSPLLQSTSINAAVRTGAVETVMRLLDGAKVNGSIEVELASLRAILKAFLGDTATAISDLTALGAKHPEHWHVWQRLSHVHWIGREVPAALEAAERAVQALPDAPALQAWQGMIQLRAKRTDEAVASLRTADSAQTGLATIPQLLAQALINRKDTTGALQAIQSARSIAPQDVRAALLEAEILRDMGRLYDAAIELQKMVEWQCATGRVFVMLVNLLRAIDQDVLAAEIARMGAERFPKHPRIVALGQELAA